MFLVIEETWQLFIQTGNIEAYLLFKELEKEQTEHTNDLEAREEDSMHIDV